MPYLLLDHFAHSIGHSFLPHHSIHYLRYGFFRQFEVLLFCLDAAVATQVDAAYEEQDDRGTDLDQAGSSKTKRGYAVYRSQDVKDSPALEPFYELKVIKHAPNSHFCTENEQAEYATCHSHIVYGQNQVQRTTQSAETAY